MSLPTPARRIALALASLLLLAGCAADEIASPSSAARPALSFMNGPGQLPYVMRFEQRTIAGWTDPERNLAVIIGAPATPALSRVCGGPVRAEFVPMQLVGDFDGVITQLALDPDVSVLVYDEIAPSLVDALCGAEPPAAVGRGFYMRNDNDLLGTGAPRANAFSEHLHATVNLAAGGTGIVTGTLHGLALRGALVFVHTSVALEPTGR